MDADDEGAQVLGLTEILRVLQRQWRWWVGSIVALLILTLALSLLRGWRYEASARILVRTVASDAVAQADPNSQVAFFADRQLADEIQVIESTKVQDRVKAVYHGPLDVADVTARVALKGSDVVELSASGANRDDVADLVNTYATEYLKYRRESRVKGVIAAATTVQKRLDNLQKRRADLAAPLDQVNSELAKDPGNEELRKQRDSLALDLAPQLSANDEQRKLYAQQRENLQLTADLAAVNAAEILTKAEPPTDPVSPRPLWDATVAIMAGFAIGVALAFAAEFLESSRSSAATS